MPTANLTVTTTDRFSLVVWIYDLNAPGTPSQQVVPNANGALLNQGATLTVPLIVDGAGNVSYHWAAEEIAVRNPRHETGFVPPVAPRTLSISLTATGRPLPYMFRPYP
jgi:hypothetical protein